MYISNSLIFRNWFQSTFFYELKFPEKLFSLCQISNSETFVNILYTLCLAFNNAIYSKYVHHDMKARWYPLFSFVYGCVYSNWCFCCTFFLFPSNSSIIIQSNYPMTHYILRIHQNAFCTKRTYVNIIGGKYKENIKENTAKIWS